MKKDLKTIILTRKELQIMDVIWGRGTATVKDVYGALSRNKTTAYTTILTLMSILEEKGVLAHTKSGRAYVFRPVLSRRQAAQNQVRDVLVRFFDGNPEKLIENLLEEEMGDAELCRSVKASLKAKAVFSSKERSSLCDDSASGRPPRH